MAIIDPDGLFSGDRLAACSDLAQLYWPRLFIAANSCARLELSYTSIISKIFKNFRKPPKSDELWAIFEEYDKNCLAILYEVNGTWWCQFVTSEKYLPKYKRTRDSLTPAPPPDALDVFKFGYLEWKKTNSFTAHVFRNVLKVSDGKGREGVGVGIGVGEESTLARPLNGTGKAHRARFTPGEIESIYERYPRKVAKAEALRAISKALDNLDDQDPVGALRARVMQFAASPAGHKGQYVPYPASWFNAKHYLDDPKEWEQ